jgi:hypothetical protein
MKAAFVIVQYDHRITEPAVPSAEPIGTGATGNGRVRSCRNNSQRLWGAESRASGSLGLAASMLARGTGLVTSPIHMNCLRRRERQ